MVTIYIALKYAPLGLTSILSNMYPLIASCLAAWILKEQIKLLNYVTMLSAFVGVVFINIGSKMEIAQKYPFLQYGLLNAFLYAIFIAIVQIFIKLMNRELHYIYSAFYSGIAGIWVILYCLITNYEYTFSKFDLTDYLLIVSGISLEIVGINANTISYKFGEIQLIAPIFHSNLVICILIDVIFLGYVFSWNEAIGSIVILVSLSWPIYKNLQTYFQHKKA